MSAVATVPAAVGSPAGGGPPADGRRRRRATNRQTVLQALVDLFAEGVYQPSAADIAARAGISPRSLFRYFDDVDDLSRAAIEFELSRARPLFEVAVPAGSTLGERVDLVAAARVRLFAAIAPAARAARVSAHRNAVVAAQVAEARRYLRHQLSDVFAAELAGARAGRLPALDALCSFEAYDLLQGQGLTAARIAAVVADALGALLDDR